MKEIMITMSHDDYVQLLHMDGIGTKAKLLKYINDTFGLLGTVTEIAFEH